MGKLPVLPQKNESTTLKVPKRYRTLSMLNYTCVGHYTRKGQTRVYPFSITNTVYMGCTIIFSEKYLTLTLSYNRTLKSGQRRWSITLQAVVNSPVTAPFPSMPGRSGAWSPVWRRSLLLMILANPAPPYCNGSCGPTTEEKPRKLFHCVPRLHAFTDPLTASVAAI